ncbi:hypothetical protein ISM_03575 [Roseovarius nubinhibens ISM]|uniref:Sulfotransferase n=2 Tax=Roseovarius nubinhibens TaxID=314263 RepID=A3SJ07_ROSNI|nr:hypothetical protein ISM_03575 [Roseovarius nubinhibens ISM]
MPTGALKAFQRSLQTIANAEDRPLVFKNLYAGLRLEPIVAMFPDAIFIHVQRDRVENAISILEGRNAANGNFNTWWSVPPPGYEAWIGQPAADQVMAQIDLIEAQIDRDTRNLGLGDQMMKVNYRDICADPAAFLSRAQTFLNSRGVELSLVGDPPMRFERRRSNQLPKEIVDRLWALEQGTTNDV